MYTAAHNVYRDHLKASRRQAALAATLTQEPSFAPSPEDARLWLIEEALHCLGAENRELVTLARLHDL
jgi:DNA-directed RNA polymerase specialized sigma24 family protein